MSKEKEKKTKVKTINDSLEKDVVSVVMTFYGAEQFIYRAITSVGQQWTDDNFKIEFILVDDKSKDNSRKIVEDYAKWYYTEENKEQNDISFRIIEPEENLGCGGARKFGIDATTGDYIMFLDADDYYINKDFVKRAYHTMIDENPDIIEYGIIYNQQDGSKNNSASNQRLVIENPVQALVLMFSNNLIKFNVWSKCYKREIVMSFPYSITRTFEDVRTTPTWCHNAKKIIIEPTCEINYRVSGGSIIHADPMKTRIETITAIAENFEKFKGEYQILKAMYTRSMVDIKALMENHSSNDPGFNEMSRLNTYMLSFLYPSNYKDYVYHVEDDPELHPELKPTEEKNEENVKKVEN